jgi:hypothetical protein
MLFWLVTAMQPRFMMTVDENLEMLPVTVRVGQVSFATILLFEFTHIVQ